MKMFSDCSGSCFICKCSGFCLAGHGDDDFIPVSLEKMNEIKNDLEDKLKNETDFFKEYEIKSKIEEINKRLKNK